MASSKAVRSCLLAVLVLVAIAPPAYAQCNITLLESVAANPALSQFAQVLVAAGLSDKISKTENVTVLAPNNVAFQGLNATLALNNLTLANVTREDSNRAASILLFHIIPSHATVSQLMNGQSWPTSLTGYNVTVSKINPTSTTTTVTFVGNVNNATVVTADLLVCNSVVHVINRVLLPNATLSAIPIYDENTPTLGVGGSGASGLATGAWTTFVLSGALAMVSLMIM